ncbi:hypothetical protein [Acinetobacter variabilis]|uniref:hypothetical protein n=1 Tax=Acinetobacter variabilis TaxID=70346 RepID=UPI00376F7063
MNTAHKYDDQVIIPTIAGQLELLSGTDLNKELAEHVFHEAPDIDLSIYDIFIVCLSGGKDSIAAYLRLLEAGVDKSKISFGTTKLMKKTSRSWIGCSWKTIPKHSLRHSTHHCTSVGSRAVSLAKCSKKTATQNPTS